MKSQNMKKSQWKNIPENILHQKKTLIYHRKTWFTITIPWLSIELSLLYIMICNGESWLWVCTIPYKPSVLQIQPILLGHIVCIPKFLCFAVEFVEEEECVLLVWLLFVDDSCEWLVQFVQFRVHFCVHFCVCMCVLSPSSLPCSDLSHPLDVDLLSSSSVLESPLEENSSETVRATKQNN